MKMQEQNDKDLALKVTYAVKSEDLYDCHAGGKLQLA